MNQLLCIAYFFPPYGGGGVQRTLKFAKYLPDFGWQPTILTARANPSLSDPTLAAEVPSQTRIVRVGGPVLPSSWPWRLRSFIKRWLLVVDEQIGWLPFATQGGLSLLRDQSYRVLYSTATPYTDHLVALRLRRASQLPWIADFRDPWLDNVTLTFATPLHRVVCAHLERDILRTADRILVVSEPMRQQFLARYPDLPSSRIVTLPNGFDPEDFQGIEPAAHDARLTLVYTGSLYGARSARPFLEALRDTLDRGLIPRNALNIRFVGNTGYELGQLVSEWGLGDIVELVAYSSHAQAIAHQLAADGLLLIIAAGPGSKAVLTAKIFEYLACGKPILALVPPGAALDLLAEAGVGRMVPPDDVDAIATAVVCLLSDWQSGQLKAVPDRDVVARYDRRRQAGLLAQILNELADERK
jgi:glycosyltransferase involved in cell wall biosynthesis